jgi:hypothetical protein
MSTFTYVTLALADVNFFNYLNDRISLIDHQIKMNQQSLHLSEESTDNESKTKSASLAHRDSTLPENDLDASYHDEDDDAFEEEHSDTEKSHPVKIGRGKEKEYDQIEQFPDFITAKTKMETYNTYHFRYEKKSINQGDKSYYSCNNQPKCPKLMYLLKVSISIYI